VPNGHFYQTPSAGDIWPKRGGCIDATRAIGFTIVSIPRIPLLRSICPFSRSSQLRVRPNWWTRIAPNNRTPMDEMRTLSEFSARTSKGTCEHMWADPSF
jgi:hypothetical protein